MHNAILKQWRLLFQKFCNKISRLAKIMNKITVKKVQQCHHVVNTNFNKYF